MTIPGAPNCYVFPADNVWNMRVDTLPWRRTRRRWSPRSARARTCIPTSRRSTAATTAFRTTSLATATHQEEGQVPVRGTVGQGSVSDPQEPQDRGRFGPPHADRPEATSAGSTSCSRHARRRPAGRPARARSGTCPRTHCGRRAGPLPTRPDCRSCRAWCATRRSPRARSTTPCASPPRHPEGVHLSGAPLRLRLDRARHCRRWACASD